MTSALGPLPYSDDVETIPADEADDIQRVVQALELILARSQENESQDQPDHHVILPGRPWVIPKDKTLQAGAFAHVPSV